MADIVRLSIVYDTSQAVASTNRLANSTTRLARVTTGGSSSLKGMALAGLRLSQGLATGNLSAMALATSLGKLAGGAVLGAVVVSAIAVINAFKEFKRITDDITNSIDAMQTAARDARLDVARLLGEAPAESNAEKAIKRLKDAAAQLRKEAARIGGPAGKLLLAQAAGLDAEVVGIGDRARRQRAREAAVEAAKQARAEVKRGVAGFKGGLGGMSDRDISTAIGMVMPRDRISATVEDIRLLSNEIDELARGGSKTADQLRATGAALLAAEKRLADFTRAANLLHDGLSIMADSIEDFVIRGTFAFREFMDNLFRLLYRDFTQPIIHGIVSSAIGSGGTGVITSGTPTTSPVPSPSIQPIVQFNVQAMDAQSVAAFFEREGGRIAATVTKQVERSGSMRQRMSRK